jgi:hypothetical protein
MVERNLTKSIYKIELVIIKFIPYIIALVYLLNNILSYIGIDLPILSLFAGTSILTILFLYISSFVFKFCIYHRLPLYYIFIADIINYYDNIIGIPINNRSLFILNLIIAGVFILLIVYFKFKQHESRTSK